MKQDVGKLTDDELTAIVGQDEHTEYSDDGGYIHAYWDCITCDAQQELDNRRAVENSQLPGECTAIYIPGVQTATLRNAPAIELKEGWEVKHYPKPGSRESYYVRATLVEKTESTITVTWEKTNTPLPTDDVFWDRDRPLTPANPSFRVTYAPNDRLEVSYTAPIIEKRSNGA